MLGKRLKELRGKRSQEEIAEKIGISRARLSHYENDRSQPDHDLLSKLADFYKVKVDYLLGRTDTPDETVDHNKTEYDSLGEINKLVKKYGIEQMGFFDIEEWKNLGPEDVLLLEEHFKMIVKLAKQRNKRNEEKE